jgi:hypothetical protein
MTLVPCVCMLLLEPPTEASSHYRSSCVGMENRFLKPKPNIQMDKSIFTVVAIYALSVFSNVLFTFFMFNRETWVRFRNAVLATSMTCSFVITLGIIAFILIAAMLAIKEKSSLKKVLIGMRI